MSAGEVQIQIERWLEDMLNVETNFKCEEDLDENKIPKDKINNDSLERPIVSACINGQIIFPVDYRNAIYCQGAGSLTFSNGDYFNGEFYGSVFDREGVLTKISCCGLKTIGKWKNGLMEGLIEIELRENGTRYSNYCKGVRHGMSRDIVYSIFDKKKCGTKIVYYKNDFPTGISWERKMGNGFTVGPIDNETEELNGKEVLFIYPDLKMGIRSRYEDGKFINGKMCKIVSAERHVSTGILEVSTSPTFGPLIKRDVSTATSISKIPSVQDFWESQRVEVRMSSLDNPGAGEGLYTKILIEKNQLVALYNGIRIPAELGKKNNDKLDFDYRIKLNGETDIDIPVKYRSLENYSATLAHKSNHSFKPNCRFSCFNHPRFGLICAIYALRDLQPGEEILVNYGISMADAPMWYKTLWVQHLRQEKGWNDEEILRWCGRQYSTKLKSIQLPLE